MIKINKGLYAIRCSRYQYLIKKGSMSNYSFDILDEDKSGILDLIFEKTSYPIDEKELKENIMNYCENITEDKMNEFINNLREVELLIDIEKHEKKIDVMLIIDSESKKCVEEKLNKFNYNCIATVTMDEINNITLDNRKLESLDDSEFVNLIKMAEYIVVLSKGFQPDLFYKINYHGINLNKKLVISYLDGDEGIIVPIVNASKTGCYNDFEMLRESSFHNLLDYQIMKEDRINNNDYTYFDELYYGMLVDYTILLLNNYSKYSYINSYAYSLDFERMVTSKIRLLKFPKCPSCQGDSNLTHPFI